MNRRYRIYLGVIALLAAVNVGRWVFAGGRAEPASRERMLLADDFRLRVDVPGASTRGRDLFSAGGGVRGAVSAANGQSRRKSAPRIAPAPVPAADAAQVMAASGLGKLRLLGVVFHGGKRQAYLAQDKENCIASTGDTVFGQYAIDAVSVDAVELRDIKTNMTRRIPVSGK
jgi:hypothetical protein